MYITTDAYGQYEYGIDVYIEEGFSGTGFAIGKKGKPVEYIVTNAHVTEMTVYSKNNGQIVSENTGEYATGIKVYFNEKSNDYMIPQVVYFDRDKDICILKLPEATTKREPLPIADADKVNSGDTVYILGYPDYGSNGQSEAIKHDQTDVMVAKGVVAKRTMMDWYGKGKLADVFMTDVISSSGNSGGPTINEKGAVVGIYSGRQRGGSGTTSSGVSICSAELIRALDSIGMDSYEIAGSGNGTVILIVVIAVVAVAAVAAVIVIGKKKTAQPAAQSAAPAQSVAAPVQSAAPAARGSVAIVGVSGNFKDSTFVLNDKLVIGRNPASCSICYPVDTKGVSGVHCEIRKKGSNYELVDCGSSNGTFIGSGQKLQPNVPVLITNGTYFYLGSTAQMFQIKEL